MFIQFHQIISNSCLYQGFHVVCYLTGRILHFLRHKNWTNTVPFLRIRIQLDSSPPLPLPPPRQLKCHKTHHSNSVVWWHKSHPIQRRAYPLTHVTGRFCSMCVTTICQLKERPHVSDNRLSLRQTPTHHAVPNERLYLLLHVTKSPFYRHLHLRVQILHLWNYQRSSPGGSAESVTTLCPLSTKLFACVCRRMRARTGQSNENSIDCAPSL